MKFSHLSSTPVATAGNDGEPSYCLCLACDVPSQRLAAATSDLSIKLHDRQTMQFLSSLDTQGRVNELCYGSLPAPVLCSASSDGLVRVWDARAINAKPSMTIQDPTVSEEIWSLDLGQTHILATGTESAVVLWDARKPEAPLCRWEVHTEAVTQVRFAASDSSHRSLFSGSVDGLICELDCSQTDEEEAVVGGARPSQ